MTSPSGRRPRAIAHRGWHIDDLAGCENTVAAFRRAVDEGFDHVELDVRTTRDGELVVFHDETIDRLTAGSGPLAGLRWAELRDVPVAGREPIPLLREVLAAVPGIHLTIEPKTDDAIEPLLEVLRDGDAMARVCIGSFSRRRIDTVRRLGGPALATSLAPSEVGAMLIRGRAGRLPAGVLGAQVPVRFKGVPVTGRRLVRAAHGAGIEVHCWTIDDAPTMRMLLELGVDGIMTDRPDILRSVLT